MVLKRACIAAAWIANVNLPTSALKTAVLQEPVEIQRGNVSIIAPVRRQTPKRDRQRLGALRKMTCDGVGQVLRSSSETSMAAKFWDIACEDRYECDTQLPEIARGCIYVSSNVHLKNMLGSIGRPNPCSFQDLFINSFFSLGECPDSEILISRPATSTSDGGHEYKNCEGGGFSIGDGSCVKARFSGHAADQSISVYVVDSNIGLPAPWEKLMSQRPSSSEPPVVDPAMARVRRRVKTDINIHFYVCHNIAPQEKIEELATRQLEVLQQAHDGNLTCDSNYVVYDAHETSFLEKGLSFKSFDASTDITYLSDSLCSECDVAYKKIWKTYMPPERDGKVKVLLCKPSTLLGITEFPWNEPRGIMIDFRTMPGGGMTDFEMGKTLVHEMGHYFGLHHTFEKGCEDGDGLTDTPPEDTAFFGCPDPERAKAGSYKSCGDRWDPIHSFLDYTDDKCMCSFTHQQYEKLLANAEEYIY